MTSRNPFPSSSWGQGVPYEAHGLPGLRGGQPQVPGMAAVASPFHHPHQHVPLPGILPLQQQPINIPRLPPPPTPTTTTTTTNGALGMRLPVFPAVSHCMVPNCINIARMEGKCMHHYQMSSPRGAMLMPKGNGHLAVPTQSMATMMGVGMASTPTLPLPVPVPVAASTATSASVQMNVVPLHPHHPKALTPGSHGQVMTTTTSAAAAIPRSSSSSNSSITSSQSGGRDGGGEKERGKKTRRLNEEVERKYVTSTSSGASSACGGDDTEHRRERNRVAAQKSRQRKLDRIRELELEKEELEAKHAELAQETMELQKALEDTILHSESHLDNEVSTELRNTRMNVIKNLIHALNTGNFEGLKDYLHSDLVISGPLSSAQLTGRNALLQDYCCTKYLYDDFNIAISSIENDTPRSKHFRVHWTFSGRIKNAGASSSSEFTRLVDKLIGHRVSITGVTTFSFSGERVFYIQRTADQAAFLAQLVQLDKASRQEAA